MAAKELTEPPSLTSLYAKAAVTAPLHRGDSLPDSTYALSDQSIELGHLAEYQRVCGFRIGDVLPPTYLHILAFPLSVALMTEQSFPFPLIGLVHVGNTLSVARPVRADERVSLRVRADDLRPHSAGRQFDLVAQATVDGQVVWSSRSTYLRRGKPAEGSDDKKERKQVETPSGAVALVKVPDSIGRRYGAVSGDRNPIHMHALTARAFGFPKAIAHGMWLKARTLATLEGRLPSAFDVEVAFKTPVFLPSTVAITDTPVGDGWSLDVGNAKSGKPHLTGSLTARG